MRQGMARWLLAAAAAGIILLCAGCSVSEMSTLRELSRPYLGEYKCETLICGGTDMLSAFSGLRLTLTPGGEARFDWKNAEGGGASMSLPCETDIENGLVTLHAGGISRTATLQGGVLEMRAVMCGRLLYARFLQ